MESKKVVYDWSLANFEKFLQEEADLVAFCQRREVRVRRHRYPGLVDLVIAWGQTHLSRSDLESEIF